MSLTTKVGLLAGVSALSLTAASFADGAAGNQEARIAELEAQVNQMTSELRGDDWMTEQRADEIRGLVHDVLADADTRASLLQSGVTSGYDDGFMIGSADGAFSLKLNGQLQVRYVYNQLDDGNIGGADRPDTNRAGFETTRTKLIFSGNVAGPAWMYYIEANFGRFENTDGSLHLEDAWIGYDMENGWKAMLGQFKVPVAREWLVHSSNQLAVERSLTSYTFSGGRSQGIAIDYANDQFHVIGSFNDGAITDNTGWEDNTTEYSMTGRAEFLFAGDWWQFRDFSGMPGSETGIMVGVSGHWQKDEFGTDNPDPKRDTGIMSADVSVEGDGWNAFAAFYYNNLSDVTGSGDRANQWGVVVQGGFFFNDKIEGYVRWEGLRFDDVVNRVQVQDVDDLSIMYIGLNAYYNEHMKATADFGYSFNQISGVTDGTQITGWRNDVDGQDGQWIIRTQLQLDF